MKLELCQQSGMLCTLKRI